MLTFGSLFAGIGGFDLGLERAGMVCKWQVEIDLFCQQVLAKHWPDVMRYADVKDCGKHNLATVDLIAGGFPCQPHSVAGQQKGAEDDRDLWPEYYRIVTELKPAWVLAENVPGIKGTILDDVLSDLEDLAYFTRTIDIPACGVGAWHRRHRFFIVAYADRPQQGCRQQQKRGQDRQNADTARNGPQGGIDNVAHTTSDLWSASGHERPTPFDGRSQGVAHAALKRRNGKQAPDRNRNRKPSRQARGCGSNGIPNPWLSEPNVGRVAHGVPNRVDRVTALGNAVVPQVVEWLGRRIVEVENGRT